MPRMVYEFGFRSHASVTPLFELLRVLSILVIVSTCSTSSRIFAQAEPSFDSPSNAEKLADLETQSTLILQNFCSTCHDSDKQEGDVRLTDLDTIDDVKKQQLFEKMQKVIHLSEMPPADAPQLPDKQKETLQTWLQTQLTGDRARALTEKLQRFEYGNAVDHQALFSGEHSHEVAFTHDRRWLISEFIFNEKINHLLNYHPTRSIYGTQHYVRGDSGVHWSPKTEWGNKERRTITNPFLLPSTVGVRYSVRDRLTTGHLLTMVGNAKRIAKHMTSESIMKAHYPAMHAYLQKELNYQNQLKARETFLRNFSSFDHLLQEIYGDSHEALKPVVVHQKIPYPGPPQHSTNGIQKRHDNLEFLDRFDHEDIFSIMQGIRTYKTTAFVVTEDQGRAELDEKGDRVWAPYREADLTEFDEIIFKCERDWFIEGVSDYRIRNRIVTMKLFFDTWDMNRVYAHVEKGNFKLPTYQPLSDAEMKVLVASITEHRRKGDRYRDIMEKCLEQWKKPTATTDSRNEQDGDERIQAVIIELFDTIYLRQPTTDELIENQRQLSIYTAKLDRQKAVGKLIESMILGTEFAYRQEFGSGDPDEHGRRLMSARDASYAIAYALTDSAPDAPLAVAAQSGKLNSRADYEREIRRILGKRDQWTIIDESVQAANLNASVTNQPIRKLRFFREFFGYPKALEVFKDDSRFGAGRHEQAVSRLIDEADMLVEHILQKDQNVFEELLTTEKFFVYHSGDNQAMKLASEQLNKVYEYFEPLEWENWEPEDIEQHRAFMMTIWEFQKTRGGENKALLSTLKRMMTALELHFGNGQSHGLPYMKSPMGFWNGGNVLGRTDQQMRGEEVTSYWNIDWRTWDYPTTQPAKIPNRKGLLTHPAWLIAHSQNLETDPIHRGKWIREKLLADTIPDVPITVDAVIPPDPHQTLRQRMENRTGETYCWRCHQKMDPLGFPFEIYDDFGRFRTDESLEHPDNLIREAKRGETNSFGASLATYKTLPVEASGVLSGTGDTNLDGEVDDAFDLIDRLARSAKARQSIIRHAFRYFMGRNETLSDSQTLINADQAYLNSNGSFDEVIVSLLTSDSFIHRKRIDAQQ